MHTILLVGAPDGDAAVLASALRVEGFRVHHAASSDAAKHRLREGPVAIALVDLMHPGCAANALELAREIRHAHPDTRVLLTSAYHLTERQLERADCGVSGFIPKPYNVDEVVSFIHDKASAPPSSRRIWQAKPASGWSNVALAAASEPWH